jgi:Ca2+-binding RTX toxin-like protein
MPYGMMTFGGTDDDDILNGSNGVDLINGHGGDDIINGGAGGDNLRGGGGNNTLNGEGGNDNLYGGAGNDTIDGGSGNDDINSGGGTDTVTGGSGNDLFRIGNKSGTLTITDFMAGDGSEDRIHLAKRSIRRAETHGFGLRLAYRISAGNPEFLEQARLEIKNEQLSLVLPGGGAAPTHGRVRRSLERLCQARKIKMGSITEAK